MVTTERLPQTGRIAFARSPVADEAAEAVQRVLRSGWITTGPEVGEFEREAAAFVGAGHAVAVSSCTAALELALRALRLPTGSNVLTSAVTFCGAVNAIIHAGHVPVLVDIDPETLMPNPETTAAAVRRSGRADAMVVLHFAGFPAPVERLAEAAGLPLDRVIEDAAHAFGTWVDDRPVGAISAATCFSFYATKNLPIGEGGMVTTDSSDVADTIRRTRLHGMSRDAWKRYAPGGMWRYDVEETGLKANMTDLQAAIGRAQLGRFPQWQQRRENLVRLYDELLAEVPGIARPPWPRRGRHAWHLYVIRLRAQFGIDRDTLIERLSQRGIDCSVHFIPIHHLTRFRHLLDPSEALPGADEAFARFVSLPLYPGLRDVDVVRVCSEIAAASGRKALPEPLRIIDLTDDAVPVGRNGHKA